MTNGLSFLFLFSWVFGITIIDGDMTPTLKNRSHPHALPNPVLPLLDKGLMCSADVYCQYERKMRSASFFVFIFHGRLPISFPSVVEDPRRTPQRRNAKLLLQTALCTPSVAVAQNKIMFLIVRRKKTGVTHFPPKDMYCSRCRRFQMRDEEKSH